MKKLLLSLSLVATSLGFSQVTLFEDSFDTYNNFIIANIGNWTLVDVDQRPTYGFGGGTTFQNTNQPMAYIVFNSTAVTTNPPGGLTPTANSNWTARTGQKALTCIAAVPNATISANNDWAISPLIALGASENIVSFWAKACDNEFSGELFNVLVSTTNTSPASFTPIAQLEAPVFGTYTEYSYDLDAYANQSVYIAIQCVSPDMFGFMVDDFKVTTAASASTNDVLASKFAITPNPATDVVSIRNNDNVLINNITISDLNGRIVSNQSFDAVTETSVNVSNLNSGVYFVNINTDQGVAVKKLVRK